eukprot:2412882-Amphidinium_carterae.1
MSKALEESESQVSESGQEQVRLERDSESTSGYVLVETVWLGIGVSLSVAKAVTPHIGTRLDGPPASLGPPLMAFELSSYLLLSAFSWL